MGAELCHKVTDSRGGEREVRAVRCGVEQIEERLPLLRNSSRKDIRFKEERVKGVDQRVDFTDDTAMIPRWRDGRDQVVDQLTKIGGTQRAFALRERD
jgi:hypothetical protein